jgi:hypothetical protein
MPPAKEEKKSAFCNHFDVEPDLFHSVKAFIIEKVVPALKSDQVTSGSRNIYHFSDAELEAITPLLLRITSEARNKIGFPVKQPMVQRASMIIAPKSSSLSNPWTKGSVHRDFNNLEQSGVYTFLLFLDEVTVENGTIQLWKGTKLMAIDERHPERPMERIGLTPELLVGPEGALYIWDARLLHRSLPNSTGEWRRTLQWYVTGLQGPYLEASAKDTM